MNEEEYTFRHQNRQNRKEKRHREPISRRERDIVRSLSYGKTHKEIGTEMFIATTTVSKHIQNAGRKLNINKETALSRWITEDEFMIKPFNRNENKTA